LPGKKLKAASAQRLGTLAFGVTGFIEFRLCHLLTVILAKLLNLPVPHFLHLCIIWDLIVLSPMDCCDNKMRMCVTCLKESLVHEIYMGPVSTSIAPAMESGHPLSVKLHFSGGKTIKYVHCAFMFLPVLSLKRFGVDSEEYSQHPLDTRAQVLHPAFNFKEPCQLINQSSSHSLDFEVAQRTFWEFASH
jgi:hypothetical protein